MRAIRRLSVLCVVIAMIGVGPANAQGANSIAGRISDQANLPLSGICVRTGVPWGGEQWSTTTASEGMYSFQDLPDGDYVVFFSDCSDQPRFLSQFYQGASDFYSATVVSLANGQSVQGIDATLALGGFVTGVLTADDASPARTCVAAFVDSPDFYGALATTFTAPDGSYRLGPLPAGATKIQFGDCTAQVPSERYEIPYGGGTAVLGRIRPHWNGAPQGYVSEWYNDQHDLYSGNEVLVASGADTPGIDGVLAIAGGITGVVKNTTGDPIPNICVEAIGDNRYGDGYTDDHGFYAIDSLKAGTYNVVFFDCQGSTYASQWFNNKPSDIVANSVSIITKTWTNDINATLSRRPRPDLAISGLTVKSVPIQADDVTVAGNPWLRTVDLDLSNLGTARPGDEAELHVWARSWTKGSVQEIAFDGAALEPGASVHRTYSWNGFGSIGDVTIFAAACSYDDANRENDVRSVRSYVGIGGVGVGLRPGQPAQRFYPFCNESIVFQAKP